MLPTPACSRLQKGLDLASRHGTEGTGAQAGEVAVLILALTLYNPDNVIGLLLPPAGTAIHLGVQNEAPHAQKPSLGFGVLDGAGWILGNKPGK